MSRKRRYPPDDIPPARSVSESHIGIRPYTRPRSARREWLARQEKEWPVLYLSVGMTIQRIADEYRTSYGRVRESLLSQGVTLRRQGGRGSLRHSPLVRIATLEDEVRKLREDFDLLAQGLALLTK